MPSPVPPTKPSSPVPPPGALGPVVSVREGHCPVKPPVLSNFKIPALARAVFSCFSNSPNKQRITINIAIGVAGKEIVFEGSGENVPMKCITSKSEFFNFPSGNEERQCTAKFEHYKSAGAPAQASKPLSPIKIGGPIITTFSINSVEEERPGSDINDSQLKIDFMFDHPNNPIRIRIARNSRVMISCMANSSQKQTLHWMIEDGSANGTFEGRGQNEPMKLIPKDGGDPNGFAFILEDKPHDRWLCGLFFFTEDGVKKAAKVKMPVCVGGDDAGFSGITVNSEGGGKTDYDDSVLRVVAMAVDPASKEY